MTETIQQTIDRSIGYMVRDITTPAEEFTCWSPDADNQELIEIAQSEGYTYLPVREKDVITGFVRVADLEQGEPSTEQLTSNWLIAADTPILHLLTLFAEEPERHFFVLSSSEIIGMVSPADLNRVPARASFYLLIAHYETLLTELIRKEVGVSSDDLEDYLSAGRIKKAIETREEEKDNNLELPIIHYVQLFDLVEIAAKHDGLRNRLGFESKKAVRNTIKFADVRNPVAHLNNVLIRSQQDIIEVNRECSDIIDYSNTIAQILNGNL